MGIGDVMGFVAISLFMIVAYPALLIVLSLFFQKRTQKARIRIEQGLIAPFFVGLVLAIPSYGLALAMISAGSVLQFLGAVLALLIATWGAIGIAGMAQQFGQRMADLSDGEQSTLKMWLSGGFVITLAIAFPLVGWFIIMPLCSVIGLGAATMSLFTRLPEAKPAIDTTLALDNAL
ncbi:MAG: hypothetical protein AAFV93_01670 [Chloroflexota bacterium]